MRRNIVERRYGPRKILTVALALYEKRGSLGRYYSTDVAMEGMFIATGSLPLARGQLVELEVLESGSGERLKGVVAHRLQQGIGVMFTETVTVFLPYLLEGLDGTQYCQDDERQ